MGLAHLHILKHRQVSLAKESALSSGMLIGIDHLHTRNGKYAPYVAICGPQGPIYKLQSPAFS